MGKLSFSVFNQAALEASASMSGFSGCERVREGMTERGLLRAAAAEMVMLELWREEVLPR